MKHKYLSTLLWCFAITSCIFIYTACGEDDGLDTNQLGSSEITLKSFGPSPIARTAELRIIGTNLDKVLSVTIPGAEAITKINVISKTEIRVQVPQSAIEGYIILTTPKGEIKSATKLTYSEPIEIKSISPNPVKAGQTLKIEGEYLNLIKEVIFADEVHVTTFVSQSRTSIELVVPAEAQTGKIIISDGADIIYPDGEEPGLPIWVYSEDELQVALPSVTATADLTNKKPGDVITITGSDLDLVASVEMPNGTSVTFTVADNKITFTLPEDVSDGAIVMIPASGVKVAIANIGVAIPSELVAIPAIDIKAGDEIAIKGINMDLVKTVTFPGVEEAQTPTSKSASEIKVIMPAAAISGDLVLNTANGNTAKVAIVTLKPKVLSYAPGSVAAGSNLVIKGQHLDLVKTVTFGGNKVGVIVSSSETELSVTVPVDAETGTVTTTMHNGETNTWSSLDITTPLFAYIPVLPDKDVEIKAGNILSIGIQNGDKLTGVQVNGVNAQYILSGTTLNVLIPNNAGGKTTLKLISSNGEVAYEINVIGSSTIETVIYTGPIELSGWGNNFEIPKATFEGVAAGSILKIYYASTSGGDAQIKLNDDDWKVINIPNDPNFSSEWGTLSLPASGTSYEITLTADILTRILTYVASWNNPAGTIIAGQNVIIAKISLITAKGGGGGGAATATTLWEGTPVATGSWSGNVTLPAADFASAKVGSVIEVTCSDVAAGAQWGIRDGGWVDIVPYEDIVGTSYTYTIDQAGLEALKATGGIFTGHDYSIAKIVLK